MFQDLAVHGKMTSDGSHGCVRYTKSYILKR